MRCYKYSHNDLNKRMFHSNQAIDIQRSSSCLDEYPKGFCKPVKLSAEIRK